ncbi:hypothetical protein MHO82_22815 [Vibrio sp. Of7-15]|uniref:hypothetical protein n=1 Tax=Vibrio sp. Of7-15 TaxID=2724879 RepID=UPI001EF2311D|nr:hypothetical protein [Vibrio sp. Of7-15]MCG7499701.1 hypothetical protein [Vibrio sp. Of7-15]
MSSSLQALSIHSMSQHILKYQQNMKSLGLYIRYSLICFALSWLVVFSVISQFLTVPNWLFFCFIISAFVSAIVLIFAIKVYAACPACNKLPLTRDKRVALKVANCTHCGEKLT